MNINNPVPDRFLLLLTRQNAVYRPILQKTTNETFILFETAGELFFQDDCLQSNQGLGSFCWSHVQGKINQDELTGFLTSYLLFLVHLFDTYFLYSVRQNILKCDIFHLVRLRNILWKFAKIVSENLMKEKMTITVLRWNWERYFWSIKQKLMLSIIVQSAEKNWECWILQDLKIIEWI